MEKYTDLILKGHFEALKQQVNPVGSSDESLLIRVKSFLQGQVEDLSEDKRREALDIIRSIESRIERPGIQIKPMKRAGTSKPAKKSRKSS